ncbi:hypothetical protein CMO86_09810 [Candidatus Woesearchaeota archaeon]|nr:hypothetical protein [Candidatus Woesearchaeota archaeon]
MPNYNKSFNFRNGVQVDVDDLIVRGNLVGIGTTIPRSDLDVRGTVDVTGIVTTTNLFVSGISTFTDELRIGTGITISPQTGIISATFFRGDASQLANLPTSQWVDVDPGLGYTSIYNVGPVGVGTTNPVHSLQIGADVNNGGNGVGINSAGHIRLSGIVTAGSFVGSGAGITAISANNISEGTLDAARLPLIFSGLTEVNTTNLVVGVATAGTLGVTTLSSGSLAVTNNTTVGGALTVTGTLVSGDATVSALNVSGVSTLGVTSFTGAVEFGSDLVFGDNITLRVGNETDGDLRLFHNGTTSFIKDVGTGNLNVDTNGSAIVFTKNESEDLAKFITDGAVELYYDNVKRFETLGIGATVIGDLKVSENATILGVSTLTTISATEATIGVATVSTFNVTESNLTNVVVSGVTTFTGAVDANGGATIDNIQIGVTDNNEIDTASGNLTIDSAGGTTTVDDNLAVTGTIDVDGNTTLDDATIDGVLDVNGSATVDNVRIDGNEIDTTSGNLTIDSAGGTTTVDDNLSVSGATALTGNLTLSADVIVSSDKNSGLGTDGAAFSDAFISEVTIGVASSEKISTRNGQSLKLDSAQGTVIVEDDFNVTGVTTAPTLNSTTINVGTENVSTALNPTADQTVPLGTSSLRYSELHVDNITVGVGSDQEITATTGNLELKAPGGNVRITNLEPVGIVTVGGDILPDGDKTRDLGSATAAFAQVHVDELRLGNSGNTLDTRTGDLTLDSATGITNVNDKLVITGDSTVSGNIFVGAGGTGAALLGPSQNIGIGTSAPTSSIQVVKYTDNELRLISENATSSITLSRDLTGATDDTATIAYNGTDLTLTNKDASGDVSVILSGGSGINTTSDFTISHGGSNIFVASHDGLVGINKATPAQALDVTGNVAATGNIVVEGTITAGQGANQVTFGGGTTTLASNIDGNINSTGISTFADVTIGVATVTDFKVTTGIGTFVTGANIGTESRAPFTSDYGNSTLQVQGNAFIEKSLTIFDDQDGSLAVGTTSIPTDDRASIGNQREIAYGGSHFRGNVSVLGDTGGSTIFISGLHNDAVDTLKYVQTQISEDHTYQYNVGINTHVPRSCLDLGGSSSPLILPSMSTTALNNLINSPSDATIDNNVDASGSGRQVPGGIFYDRQLDCVKVGVSSTNNATSFKRIIHVTMSGTIESIAFPQVTNANVTTLQNDSDIPDGAVVYNTGTNKLMVKASGTFTNLH